MVCRRRGFTLIELLVVVAIIALLMSILMPALGRVKKQAKNVACQATLHQWALVFTMYMGENDDHFPTGWASGADTHTSLWLNALRPLFGGVKGYGGKMCLCPAATKMVNVSGRWDSFTAWGPITVDNPIYGTKGDMTSYGMNGWAANIPPSGKTWNSYPGANCWRTCSVKGVSEIPVFLDGLWHHGWPQDNSPPPIHDGFVDHYARKGMDILLPNRHDGTINVLFMDWTVRNIGLKEAWTFKWHRSYETANAYTIAGYGGDRAACAAEWDRQAYWMRNMPEY